MTSARVAVIVTCHGLGRYLEDAVESVLRQTLPPAELVIIDDGSDDLLTRHVLSGLEKAGHRVIHTANAGVSAARNLGIRETTAPYVVVLDADDILEASYLLKAAARLDEAAELAFVSCGMRCFGAADAVWFPKVPELIESMTNGVPHVSSMFRREMWAAVGGFDESFSAHEEVDFWTTVLERGFRGDVLAEPLLRYRVRPDSMHHTALRRRNHLELMERFYRKHLDTLRPRAERLLIAKEQFILDQKVHHSHLRRRKSDLEAELQGAHQEIATLLDELRPFDLGRVDFGDLKRVSPISPTWGFDRGIPLDRYYIHQFLETHRTDVHGRTLEVKNASYTRQYGAERVLRSDVVDIDADNPAATIVADLTDASKIEDDTYDCFILTQTLGEIFHPGRAVREAFRILKPGGVLLCTVPASGRISYENGLDRDYWRFTEASVRTLFADAFPLDAFDVTGFGNVLARAAFLYGLAPEELAFSELDANDPFFPVVYGVRAVKPLRADRTPARKPSLAETRCRANDQSSAVVLMYHRIASNGDERNGLCIPPDDFRTQMQHLSDEGYLVTSLRELAQSTATGLRERMVAITLDDGYSDALTGASEILEAFSFPATFFLVGETLDGADEFWWDLLERIFLRDGPLPTSLPLELPTVSLDVPTATKAQRRAAHDRVAAELPLLAPQMRNTLRSALLSWSGVAARAANDPRAMTVDEVLRLVRQPGATIGAHTESHVWLPSLPEEVRWREIATTKQRLETLTGRPVTAFSYPWGAHDASTVDMVRKAGFEVGVTTKASSVTNGCDRLVLPRYDAARWRGAAFAANLRRIFRSAPRISSTASVQPPRVLVAGWFSFQVGHATAGDLLARDLVCDWLTTAGYAYDVATVPPFDGGIDWKVADPARYCSVVFVCGPFAKSDELEVQFITRFKNCRLVGVNLSMLLPIEDWNPFHALWERDSSARARPDIVFASPPPQVPVVGVCLVEDYNGADTASANAAIERLVDAREMAVVRIDSRLDLNESSLRTPGEVEALLARMDVVVTTRLHGTVLALKNGVPAIAIDPEPGGAKILKQARALGWPWVFTVDAVSDLQLQRALDHCLTPQARIAASACCNRTGEEVKRVRDEFIAALSSLHH